METRTLPARQKNTSCCAGVEPASLASGQSAAAALVARALGDETRLRLLDVLAQQPAPLCVCDLTPLFPQHQPTISHHLRLLREAGLIETERRGIWSYYWATARGRRCLAAIADLD